MRLKVTVELSIPLLLNDESLINNNNSPFNEGGGDSTK